MDITPSAERKGGEEARMKQEFEKKPERTGQERKQEMNVK